MTSVVYRSDLVFIQIPLRMSLERFVGNVAVVTGASSGIGRAIAEALVKHGVIVAGIARRVERVIEQSNQLYDKKGKLHAFKADLTSQQEIISVFKKITEELGPVHILVNSAGLLLGSSIIDGEIDKWKPVLDTNVLAVAIATREAIKSMKIHNIKGHIININSVFGHSILDSVGVSVYPASKFAVTGLTETIRLEINRAKLPIKITSLSPGYVRTEFLKVAFGTEIAEKKDQSRPGLASEDVADAVLYILATPEHVNIKELIMTVQGQFA